MVLGHPHCVWVWEEGVGRKSSRGKRRTNPIDALWIAMVRASFFSGFVRVPEFSVARCGHVLRCYFPRTKRTDHAHSH